MPEAIAITLAEAIGTAWAADAALYVIGNAVAINSAAWLVASTTYGNYRQRKAAQAGQAAYRASIKDREVTLRSGIAPRRYIYGRDRVSGPLVYAESTGTKKEFLHIVIALAAHECAAIEEVWFGDVLLPAPDVDGYITSGEFSKVTTTSVGAFDGYQLGGQITLPHYAARVVSVTRLFPNDGGSEIATGWAHTAGNNVVTGLTGSDPLNIAYEYQTGTPKVRIKHHLGASGQVADAALVAESNGKWTTNHSGQNTAYSYLRFEWDKEIFGSVGIPDARFVIKGRKVEDTRTVSVAWSDNVQIVIADWLKRPEGLGASVAEVPSAETTAGANICDELIELNVLGTATQRRYTFNGSFTSDQSPLEVRDELLQAMAGACVWVQGRWLTRPGAFRTPGKIITDASLAGDGVTIIPKASRSELFNAVRATYRDPSKAWEEVQAPMVQNAMYKAADGGVLRVRNIQLVSAMDHWRAQRLAKIELERGRQALSVQISTNLSAYNISPTDNATLKLARYGWGEGKYFEVLERSFTGEGDIGYALRETAAGVWEWAYGEATIVDLAPDTALPNPYLALPALTGLAVASGTAHLLRSGDGSIITRAYVSWNQSTNAFVLDGGSIDLQWRLSSVPAWQSKGGLDGDAVSSYVSPVEDGSAVIFRVRQVNGIGRASPWAYETHEVVGKIAPPSTVTGFTAGTVAQGVIPWTWAACPDIDYSYTEIRTANANWGSDSVQPLFRGKAQRWPEFVTAVGTYTRYAKHFDTSGNQSAAAATAAAVVDAAGLVQTGSFQLRLIPSTMSVTATAAGTVTSWAPAKTTAQVIDPDGVDVTANWGYAITSLTNVTGTIGGTLNNEVSLTGFASGVTQGDYANALLQVHGYPSAADTSQFAHVPVIVGAGVTFGTTTPVVGNGYLVIPAGNWSGVTAYAAAGGTGTTGVRFGGSDYISSVGRGLVDLSGEPWEISCWVRVQSYVSVYINLLMAGTPIRGLMLDPQPAGWRCFGEWSHVAKASFPDTSITTTLAGASSTLTSYGAWAHIKFAYCTDGNLRMWLGGVLQQSVSIGTGRRDNLAPDSPYGTTFAIGSDRQNSAGQTGPEAHICELRHLSGVPNTSANFTPTTVPFGNSPYPAGGRVTVTATKAGETSLTASADLIVIAGAPASVVASVTPATLTIPAGWDGVVTGNSATAYASVLLGGADNTASWGIAVTRDQIASLGGTVDASARSIVLGSMHVARNDGDLRVWLSRPGYRAQKVVVPVYKSIAQQPTQSWNASATVITLAGDTAGVVPSYTGATSTVQVREGGTLVSGYAYAVATTTGITASVSANPHTLTSVVLSVTAITSVVDSGTVTLTLTKAGWPTIIIPIAVAKSRLLLPAGAVVASMSPIAVFDDAGLGGASTVRVRYRTDGTIQTWRDSAAAWVAAGNWYNPTTTSIGSTHYVRINAASTTNLGGTYNAWNVMTSDVEYSATAPVVPGGASATLSSTAFISTSSVGATVSGQGPVGLTSTLQGS